MHSLGDDEAIFGILIRLGCSNIEGTKATLARRMLRIRYGREYKKLPRVKKYRSIKNRQKMIDDTAKFEEDAANGNDLTKKVEAMAGHEGAQVVVICASIESEIRGFLLRIT